MALIIDLYSERDVHLAIEFANPEHHILLYLVLVSVHPTSRMVVGQCRFRPPSSGAGFQEQSGRLFLGSP